VLCCTNRTNITFIFIYLQTNATDTRLHFQQLSLKRYGVYSLKETCDWNLVTVSDVARYPQGGWHQPLAVGHAHMFTNNSLLRCKV